MIRSLCGLAAFRTMATAATAASAPGTEKATIAGGCFWCIEAAFHELKGVRSAISGYIGGSVKNPKYEQICEGDTGHAEAVEVTYDTSLLTYAELLDIFFTIHDPTTLNRQGNDVGTQYRSAIFYHSPEQLEAAKAAIARHQPRLKKPIVTTLEPATIFYPAEDYHQKYSQSASGKRNPYVAHVVMPKVEKTREYFPEKLK